MYPDEIKQGWSVARLWHLWCCLIALDLASSTILAVISWRKRLDNLFHWTHAPSEQRLVLMAILYILLGIAIIIPSVILAFFAWASPTAMIIPIGIIILFAWFSLFG